MLKAVGHVRRRRYVLLIACKRLSFVYIALSNAGRVVAKSYKSRIWDKVPEGSSLIFGYTLIFLEHSVG